MRLGSASIATASCTGSREVHDHEVLIDVLETKDRHGPGGGTLSSRAKCAAKFSASSVASADWPVCVTCDRGLHNRPVFAQLRFRVALLRRCQAFVRRCPHVHVAALAPRRWSKSALLCRTRFSVTLPPISVRRNFFGNLSSASRVPYACQQAVASAESWQSCSWLLRDVRALQVSALHLPCRYLAKLRSSRLSWLPGATSLDLSFRGTCSALPACFVSTRTFPFLSTSIPCVPISSAPSATSQLCRLLLRDHVCCCMHQPLVPSSQP